MPVNEYMSITFTSAIFTTIFAVLILKEKIGIHRIVAILVGFCGTIIILQPSIDVHNNWVFVALANAALFGLLGILFKIMMRTEKLFTIIFYIYFFSLILSAPFAYFYWEIPTLRNIAFIVAIAVFDLLAITAFLKALSYADISYLTSFSFSKLIFTAIIAYFTFGEKLGLETVIGSIIIVGSNIYIAKREAKAHQKVVQIK